MEILKNNSYVVDIEDMGSEGEGIGKIDGYPLFIKDAIIGDQIRAKVIKTKKNYGYARVEEIIIPSPDRVEPVCPVAKSCGGCSLQHLSYEKQLEYKQNKIKNCLERIGKFEQVSSIMEPIIGMEEPYYYRNKAQFPVGRNKEGKTITGFYAGRTHSIIDNSHCYIQARINEEIMERVKAYLDQVDMLPYDEKSHTGVVRHILTRVGFVTGEIMVCLVINGNKLVKENILIDSLKDIAGMTSISFNINKEKTNRILGNKIVTIWGQEYITDYIGDVKYQISPLSFYQVNPVQTQKLYRKALEYAGLTGSETVWDLYCGIGTISLFLAQKAKQVYGVEIVPEAIADARVNAKINNMDNVEFFVGKAEEVLPREYEKNQIYADVIVVDPPRKGCEASLLDTIVEMHPERVVYVSCDPGTLARDLRYLADRGYALEKVCGADMFGMTGHVETVCLIQKKN